MNTKKCPYCHEEISEEAIICKFCHKLLIDENGNDILPEGEAKKAETQNSGAARDKADAAEETQTGEDKTIVYNKDELKKALESGVGKAHDEDAPTDDEQSDEVLSAEAEDENNTVPVPPDRDAQEEYDYDYEDYEGYEDYDPKRTFTITAFITVGILIVLIAAIVVGTKLFGSDKDTSDKTSKAKLTTTGQVQQDNPEVTTTNPDDSYVPQVTDDTPTGVPEDPANSAAVDPVTQTGDSSLASTVSGTDSTASASSSTDSAAGDGPSITPAGSYYSWDEANTLWDNYRSANGMNGEQSYYGGTDGVEMLYAYTDDNGNTTIYRVDLQTGSITAQ